MSVSSRNVALYPWFKFAQNLLFWQATWFLFFQNELSGAEAILLYAIYDLATTLLEVPSGWISDRIGRRPTLILSSVFGGVACLVLASGDTFSAFILGQVLLGASIAFVSGTDSATLFEALAADGRESEVEAQELKAWRATFTALAVSAVIGGLAALWSERLPFVMSGVAFAAATLVAFRFAEPPRVQDTASNLARLRDIPRALSNPALAWIFALAVLMYGYSHIPFVFGQPFILEALSDLGWAGEAPVVSGGVSATMMIVSVLTSLIALRLRHALGLPGVLLLAFGLQVALAAVLAASNAAIVIAVLFLRMVPSSLSGPFILARIQPLLQDRTRATYLSVQSLVSRIVFAISLWLASVEASKTDTLSFAEIRGILIWYAVIGVLAFAALAFTARRARIEDR